MPKVWLKLCFVFFCCLPLALAQTAVAANNSLTVLEQMGLCQEGADLVKTLEATVRKWRDYSCENELWTYKPDRMTKSGCKFFYKDNQVRVQVVGGGFRDGTLLVKSKDGKIRVQGGIFMGFMKMNLDPDSRMLILPNGMNVIRTDLPNVFRDFTDELSHGFKCRMTTTPVLVDELSEKVYVLDEYEPDASKQMLRRRLFLEVEKKMPVRVDLYKGGKRVSSAWFKNLTPNAGLTDDLFKL